MTTFMQMLLLLARTHSYGMRGISGGRASVLRPDNTTTERCFPYRAKTAIPAPCEALAPRYSPLPKKPESMSDFTSDSTVEFDEWSVDYSTIQSFSRSSKKPG